MEQITPTGCTISGSPLGDESVAKTYVEDFGDEIIKSCGGLPLAITVLGGILATKQTREEWEDVLKHAKSYLHEEDPQVNNVLALSYNYLPSHLKPCFLYLGHFPKDSEIRAKDLIRMWMGEGFISQIQYRGGSEDTMDDVGHRYLRELVQRGMVLVGKRGSLGRIKTCQMHDHMRDFCISKAQEENFLHITNNLSMKQCEAQINKVRRLAIIMESSDNSIKGIKFNEHPYLRSLLHFLPPCNESYFKDSCFKKFKLVRVLHLENFNKDNKKLPKDIGCLIHLRYLSLKGSNINEVPSSIGNLRCLETLDLRTKVDLSDTRNLLDYLSKPRVPNVFKYMKQLKHLYLPLKYRVSGKLELENLSYLQTLVNVQPTTIQIPTWFKLNRLQVLRVMNDELAQNATLILEVLSVMNDEPAQDATQILIWRCPHAKSLTLKGIIEKLPEVHQFSQNLAKLTLEETYLKEDQMETLEKLPNLKILRLFLRAFNQKKMVCSKRGFPQLQSLVLSHLFKLEEWKVEEGAMPRLCHLRIESCVCLETIPDGLTKLQELEFDFMPANFKKKFEKEGPDFYKVQHVHSLVFKDCY